MASPQTIIRSFLAATAIAIGPTAFACAIRFESADAAWSSCSTDEPVDPPAEPPLDVPSDTTPEIPAPPADPVQPTLPAPAAPAAKEQPIELATAPDAEADALNRLAGSPSWPLRALAVMRLERFDCQPSADRLLAMASDRSWRVRSYAFGALARRGVAVPVERLLSELDPRVLRTILRGRYALPIESIDRRIEACEESQNLLEAMVALECLAALGKSDEKLIRERMDELIVRIVFRMNRTQAGVLSSRLAAITSGRDSGRDYRWREWHNKNKREPGYRTASLVDSAPAGKRLTERNEIAALGSERFVEFVRYVDSVSDRPMDLAILIDCTASMSSELAAAQGGLDDLADFLGSVTKGLRIGLVGYRDRGDRWETRASDFTASLDETRKQLWSFSAEGGGDEPESVYEAMKIALTRFSWLPDASAAAPQPIRACVIVGDAPPHVGEGTLCVELAERAYKRGVRFYGIVARESETNLKPEDADPASEPSERPSADPSQRLPGQVDPPRPPPPISQSRRNKTKDGRSHTWFPEIAAAGGGRAEILKDADSLVAEIAELAIADRFRAEFAEFFAAFRVFCR